MIEFANKLTMEECVHNPEKLYIFGENQEQKGTKVIGGGQAIIRGMPNAFGFCTLSAIGRPWTDDHVGLNIVQIEKDIADLRQIMRDFEDVVFPAYGLGTGRARMPQSCPKTFLYLCNRLLEDFQFNNIYYLESPKF